MAAEGLASTSPLRELYVCFVARAYKLCLQL